MFCYFIFIVGFLPVVSPFCHVQLGPRPFYLLNDMAPSELKDNLMRCASNLTQYKKTDLSLGHRGAALQFPEHTKESYMAAYTMGSGVIECDVTFTKDEQLVCRHSQCDLHSTTDILLRHDLSTLCSEPFTPAVYSSYKHNTLSHQDPHPDHLDEVERVMISPASASCCTSDITLEQFKSLRAKMDGNDETATNVIQFVFGGVPSWRTKLFEYNATLMSHDDSIKLFKSLNVKMIPELKVPLAEMPFHGSFTQQDFAQKMINEYKANNISWEMVYPQSESLDDIFYWLENDNDFGKQALFLWKPPSGDFRNSSLWPSFEDLYKKGLRTFAPPMFALIDLNNKSELVQSDLAIEAKRCGFQLKTWTLERSGSLYVTKGGTYYQSVNGLNPNREYPDHHLNNIIHRDGDVFTILHFLFTTVAIQSIFSDWPATVTFYANCLNYLSSAAE